MSCGRVLLYLISTHAYTRTFAARSKSSNFKNNCVVFARLLRSVRLVSFRLFASTPFLGRFILFFLGSFYFEFNSKLANGKWNLIKWMSMKKNRKETTRRKMSASFPNRMCNFFWIYANRRWIKKMREALLWLVLIEPNSKNTEANGSRFILLLCSMLWCFMNAK